MLKGKVFFIVHATNKDNILIAQQLTSDKFDGKKDKNLLNGICPLSKSHDSAL